MLQTGNTAYWQCCKLALLHTDNAAHWQYCILAMLQTDNAAQMALKCTNTPTHHFTSCCEVQTQIWVTLSWDSPLSIFVIFLTLLYWIFSKMHIYHFTFDCNSHGMGWRSREVQGRLWVKASLAVPCSGKEKGCIPCSEYWYSLRNIPLWYLSNLGTEEVTYPCIE